MNQTPIVSIICCTYNHEPYIAQCLEGFVRQQTNFCFEVLVHDDASTDKTADIIRKYEDTYPEIIKPIYQTENQFSQNTGILKTFQYPRAKGKYIAVCEGDDYWTDPYKLQKQVDYMEAHPECSLCSTNYSSLRMKDGYMKTDKQTSRRFSVYSIMRSNKIGTLTVLYRKQLLLEYLEQIAPIMPKFRMGDVPLWLWMASKGHIQELPDIAAVYRVLDKSASHSTDFLNQYNFEIEGCRVRLWFNKHFGWHYKPLIYMELLICTRNFCRRWAKKTGEKKSKLMKKAFRYLRETTLYK